MHAKNWRPIVLALGVGPSTRHQIAEFGYWLTAGRGVMSLGQVISGEVEDRLERSHQAERRLRQLIHEEGLSAFPAVVVDEDLLEGVKALLQCHGIGAMRPNTVLIGWSDDLEDLDRYTELLRLSCSLNRNVVIVKREQQREPWSPPAGEIHIWWHGRKHGPLMLMLAHLLTQNPEFRRRHVRLMQIVPEDSAREDARAYLLELARATRIDIDPLIIVTDNLREALLQVSQNAGIVLLGFDPPGKDEHIEFFQDIEVLTDGLHDVLLVCAAQEIDLNA